MVDLWIHTVYTAAFKHCICHQPACLVVGALGGGAKCNVDNVVGSESLLDGRCNGVVSLPLGRFLATNVVLIRRSESYLRPGHG